MTIKTSESVCVAYKKQNENIYSRIHTLGKGGEESLFYCVVSLTMKTAKRYPPSTEAICLESRKFPLSWTCQNIAQWVSRLWRAERENTQKISHQERLSLSLSCYLKFAEKINLSFVEAKVSRALSHEFSIQGKWHVSSLKESERARRHEKVPHLKGKVWMT
jgi:hypothetical protein